MININKLLHKSSQTKEELEIILNKLDIPLTDCKIDWIDNYKKTDKFGIYNLDADHIGGTHWVAIYDNKFYFDPLGFPPARDSLDYLQFTVIPIQDIKFGGCGLYSCLFLYYATNDDGEDLYSHIAQFYTLFSNSVIRDYRSRGAMLPFVIIK